MGVLGLVVIVFLARGVLGLVVIVFLGEECSRASGDCFHGLGVF